MSSAGFGICGHKNAYSNTTKCGNWVEDRFGKAATTCLGVASPPTLGSTVVRDDFIHPSRMADNSVLPGEKVDIMSAADIKTKNRNGVSFNLLFGHTKNPQHAKRLQEDRFVTNSRVAFPVTDAMPESVRAISKRAQARCTRDRLASAVRERRAVNFHTTTARWQGARVGKR
ncbi:unnamed protein product [Discosporangium mesarthrocarpum]